jgi:hypothetical protein
VVVDRDGENVASRLVNKAKAVTFSSDDVLDGERYGRSALEPTLSVDCTGVGNGDNAGRLISGEHW